MGIREDRRRERRAAVLDAAMEMIEEGGAKAVTIAAVADRIGASVGGMYRYFPTKQAIFVALQLRAIDTFEAHLKARLHETSTDKPLERVIAAFSCWLSFREIAPSYHRLLDESLSSVERTLTDGQAADVHVRLDIIIALCASTIEGAVTAKDEEAGTIEVSVRGANRLGDHVTGTVLVALPN